MSIHDAAYKVYRARVISSDHVTGVCTATIPSVLGGRTVEIDSGSLTTDHLGDFSVPEPGSSQFVYANHDFSQILWANFTSPLIIENEAVGAAQIRPEAIDTYHLAPYMMPVWGRELDFSRSVTGGTPYKIPFNGTTFGGGGQPSTSIAALGGWQSNVSGTRIRPGSANGVFLVTLNGTIANKDSDGVFGLQLYVDGVLYAGSTYEDTKASPADSQYSVSAIIPFVGATYVEPYVYADEDCDLTEAVMSVCQISYGGDS